jgi:hypothetical protein
MRDFLNLHGGQRPSACLLVSCGHAELIAKQFTTVGCVATLITTLDYTMGLFDKSHAKTSIREFINWQRARHMLSDRAQNHDGALLYLPTDAAFSSSRTFGRKHQNAFDPCKFLKVLRLNRHLKSADNLEHAVDDAMDWACDDNTDLHEAVLNQKKKAPHQSIKARSGADASSSMRSPLHFRGESSDILQRSSLTP